MSFLKTDPAKLTTKQARLIHNERVKYASIAMLSAGIAALFGAGVSLMFFMKGQSTDSGLTTLQWVRIGSVLMGSAGLVGLGFYNLRLLVDQDHAPKPATSKRQKRKRSA